MHVYGRNIQKKLSMSGVYGQACCQRQDYARRVEPHMVFLDYSPALQAGDIRCFR